MDKMEESSIDLIASDFPYGISMMNKSWDVQVPSVDILKSCLRVLKPGHFLFTTMSPRQDVLSKCISNISKAGFETNFSSIYWQYNSGFPKPLNVALAIDKDKGIKPKVEEYEHPQRKGRSYQTEPKIFSQDRREDQIPSISKPIPTSSKAKEFDGFYGGFQPKPSVEVIIVAKKQNTEKRIIDQALLNAGGGTWLGHCRIPYEELNDILGTFKAIHNSTPSNGERSTSIYDCDSTRKEFEKEKEIAGERREAFERLKKKMIGGRNKQEKRWSFGDEKVDGYNPQDFKDININTDGRFPANLLVSGDVLKGKTNKSPSGFVNRKPRSEGNGVIWEKDADFRSENNHTSGYGDIGTSNRYYSLDAWWTSYIKKFPTLPNLSVPKPSQSEKNLGLSKNKSFFEIKTTLQICKERSIIQEEQSLLLRVDMEPFQIKVIDEFGIKKKKDIRWNTSLFGKLIMEKFQKDFVSTIKTKINSITTSTILKWLISLLIKEFTLDVNLGMENGSNHVKYVENSNQFQCIINEKMESLLHVKHVSSKKWLSISVREKHVKERNIHPTSKPVQLFSYLIELGSRRGDLILDPFCGGGTTGIAAIITERKFVGCELDPDYCLIAEARLEYWDKLYDDIKVKGIKWKEILETGRIRELFKKAIITTTKQHGGGLRKYL